MQINELELARDIGTGTTSVREFLIRFSRFGLIEKRPNSHWILKGFTREFALELTEVREMFELRSAASFAALDADHPAWQELERAAFGFVLKRQALVPLRDPRLPESLTFESV